MRRAPAPALPNAPAPGAARRAAPSPAEADTQLSLFDAPGMPAATSSGPVTGPSPEPAPALPATIAPAAAAAPARRPTPWLHPRGNRELLLAGQRVVYELKRARRRTIGFVIGTEGLAVSAPRWVGQAEIDSALASKSRWILRKLADQGERLARLAAARVDWRDGASLPYLGEALVIVLDPRVRGVELRDGRSAQACADGASTPDGQGALPGLPARSLHLGLPQQAEPAQIRDAVQSWLQRQALALFEQRCRHFAPQLGVRVARLKLSSAQTRWGSASADGTVRLNWRLIHFGLASIDYVVAHELAHLREMNHSPAFWDVVRSVMPDYEARRGQLKDGQVPVFD